MASHISPLRRCCIRILESVHASNPLAIAAARAIEVDAQLNGHFLTLKASGSLSSDALLEILEEDEQLCESVETAFAAFESNPTEARAGLVEALERYRELARQRMGR